MEWQSRKEWRNVLKQFITSIPVKYRYFLVKKYHYFTQLNKTFISLHDVVVSMNRRDKCLQTPKEKSEFANRRGTDNTTQHNTQKKKRTKGQTTIYKTLHRKLKIDQHELTTNWIEIRFSGRISSSCSICVWHPSCYSCYKPDDKS